MPLPLLLFAAFVVVPLIELYIIIQVGEGIGVLPTVLILLVVSVGGAWLVRREGARAWQALKGALRSGRLPSREVTDAALVLVGGTLLLTPGFLTDALGLFLVVPLTRPLARRALRWVIARRVTTRGQRR